jgi:phosphatidylserine/phosphatidylglycerophosphate/cardiolipin synthase-like enzyme
LAKSQVYAILLVAGLLIGFPAGIIYSHVGGVASTTDRSRVIATCFSPNGNCSAVVVSWIERANKSIHVLMFTFTLQNIVQSLIAAKGRGVEVLVVLERDQAANEPVYDSLRAAGMEVRKDNNSAFMHDKFAIIDGDVVLTGSFNWTNSANEANNENLIVLTGDETGSAFERDFSSVWQHSSS